MSGCQHSAVDRQGYAGDITSGVAGEEDQCGGEFGVQAEASGEDAREDLCVDVVAVHAVAHFGFEEAGSECVHSNSLAGGPLLCKIAGEADEAGLR